MGKITMSLKKHIQVSDICAVVVIYNVKCEDSPTCQALSQMQNIGLHVLIFDNSTINLQNREFCLQKGWAYLGGLGNVGLSKAYNASIEYLKQESQIKMVCLFDDDTHIDVDYFNQLCKIRMSKTSKIYVPLIYSNDRLLSPCVLRPNHTTKLFHSDLEAIQYDGKNITAINSCMALDLSLFDDFRYDENIFLDGIDHNFLMQMKQRNEKIVVFPYSCNHSFSGDLLPTKNAALMRFSIYAKDYRYIFRYNLFKYLTLLGRRTLHLTLQYRSLCFIKIFLHILIKMKV